MNIWDAVGNVIATLLQTSEKRTEECTRKLENSYNRSSERYTKMSDEQLEKEIKRLKASDSKSFEALGQKKAMQEEINKRHG